MTDKSTDTLFPDPDLIAQSVEGQTVFGFPEDTLWPDEDLATQSVTGGLPTAPGKDDQDGGLDESDPDADDATADQGAGEQTGNKDEVEAFDYENSDYNGLRAELARRNESLDEDSQIVPESQKAEDIESALRAHDGTQAPA